MRVPSWVQFTRARCANLPLLFLCFFALSCFAQTLDTLGHNYRTNPNLQNRAALATFADAHPNDIQGAEALLVLGATDYDRKDLTNALINLRAAQKRLPNLTDYTAFLLGSAQFDAKNYPDALRELDGVWKHAPKSPLLAKAVTLAAKCDIEMQKPKDAVELLRKYRAELPEPQTSFLMATSSETMGDPLAAVAHYQTVYYTYPTSAEATQSELALIRLHESLADKYPEPAPQTMLGRAYRLLNGGDPLLARKELEALLPKLAGAELDLAKVRIGAAQNAAKENKTAYEYLKSLNVTSPDADAERLYHLHAACRRLNRDDEALDILQLLAKSHPQSSWRLEALLASASQYLVKNNPDIYVPLYKACYESFPTSTHAASCHWKVAWNSYLHRQPDAIEMLQTHLTRFPASEKAAAALYFLGRAAERSKSIDSAKTYYQEIATRFPNFFHAVLAREKLAQPEIANAPLAAATEQFLKRISFPPRAHTANFDANEASRLRVARARLLNAATLDDWAETELRFAATRDAQPQVAAMELAQMADKRGAPDQAIRYIKSFAPAYLTMPLEAAPDKFWRLAFPLPYRAELQSDSQAQSLDPFMVAALIRQESEFNPLAISHANAYGLTQVLPNTGRELSRKLGIKPFTTKMLLQPEINLKLGTYYLKSLFDQLGGRWEPTLASYNAGKSRVLNWLNFATFEEPAEFVETIPFNETRNYVQIVMRNADLYRRLYAPKTTAVLSSGGLNSKGN